MNTNVNKEIVELIMEYVKNYKELKCTETDWRDPVIGFADAEDELFPKLKNIVGPSHVLPSDLVSGARSVISFFIPFSKRIVESNISGEESSREWDIATIETNNLIDDLNKFLFEKITAAGFEAALIPATYSFEEKKLDSNWSHKSAAFISGIGKFGLNHILITESGCCGRLGSIVTDLELIPTKRVDEEYCLYKHNGSCRKCIKRCVNNAFSIQNDTLFFYREKCSEQIYDKIIQEYPIGFGDTCGKCMCGVPCSFVNPRKLK